ncbi:hypothetical protein DFJ63DRAFT_314430 [Scheffersomyces coipomensis]|uniref:uncharacterized protein n=1 Tax=Scheffersomyces coipomensis TaxID=1788519 RepID=UPI00315C59FA
MSLDYITQDSLFARIPPPLPSIDETTTLEQIYTKLTLPNASQSYRNIIDQLYYIIQTHGKSTSSNSINDLLKLWEIRFNLLMFNSEVNLAHIESININNILYLQENIQDLNVSVYPLPKLDLKYYDFLIKLLKLKSEYQLEGMIVGSSSGSGGISGGTGIINEIFKLNYQLRLKDNEVNEEVEVKLINLSYQLIINLVILNHLPTLLTFVKGVISELERKEKKISMVLEQYLSNLIIVLIIVESYLLRGRIISKTSLQMVIRGKYEDKFKLVNQFTKDSISYVINQNQDGTVKVVTITDLLDQDVTIKILVNIIGVWDLINTNKSLILNNKDNIISLKLEEPEVIEQEQEQEEDTLVDKIYNHVNNLWYKHIDKLYGLNSLVAKSQLS